MLDVHLSGPVVSVALRERGHDECFYFRNIERVRGKEDIDLDTGDPPRDLVFEVDITNPSPDKLPILAQVGVQRVGATPAGRWRFSGCEARNSDMRCSSRAPSCLP